MSSSSVKVKICGLTRYEDAALAARLGAWGVGFIFTDKSPRACAEDAAKAIIRQLNDDGFEVEKVGVFLNQSPAEINRIAAEVGLTFAQLHGTESPRDIPRLHVKALKAIQQLDIDDTDLLDSYACWLLMDAPRVGDIYGGTGHTADWDKAKALARRYPLFLAGNLGPDNVVQALEQVAPMGIDLSSSVEKSPGIKEHGKLKSLFHNLYLAGHVRPPA